MSVPTLTRRRASFEDWSAKVGGVLEVCGVEGFLDNKKFTGQDREKIAWAQIAHRWYRRYGTGEDNPVAEDKIYDLACEPAVAIIRGHNEESRRSNFMDKLPSMTGKSSVAMYRAASAPDSSPWNRAPIPKVAQSWVRL